MLCDIKFLSDVMGELYLWVSSEGSMPSGATLQTGATNKKWKVTFSNNNGVYVSEDWFMAITDIIVPPMASKGSVASLKEKWKDYDIFMKWYVDGQDLTGTETVCNKAKFDENEFGNLTLTRVQIFQHMMRMCFEDMQVKSSNVDDKFNTLLGVHRPHIRGQFLEHCLTHGYKLLCKSAGVWKTTTRDYIKIALPVAKDITGIPERVPTHKGMNPTGGVPPKVTEDGKEYYKLTGAIDWFLPKLGLEWEPSTQFAAVEVKTSLHKGSIQVNVPIRGGSVVIPTPQYHKVRHPYIDAIQMELVSTAGFTSGVTHVLVHFKSN